MPTLSDDSANVKAPHLAACVSPCLCVSAVNTQSISVTIAICHEANRRNPHPRALCRDRPDGGGLLRQLPGLDGGGPRRVVQSLWFQLRGHGTRSRYLTGRGRGRLPLPLTRPFRR